MVTAWTAKRLLIPKNRKLCNKNKLTMVYYHTCVHRIPNSLIHLLANSAKAASSISTMV